MTLPRFMSTRRGVALILAVVLVLGLFPAMQADAQSGYAATVICPSDDAHATPDINAQVMATFYNGQAVTMVAPLDRSTSWTPVILSTGQYAWMKTACLTSTTTSTDGQGGYYGGATATIATGALNVRSGPGWWYPSLTSYYRGTVLTLTGYRNADGTWVQVYLTDGRQGWISAAYANLSVSVWSLAVTGQPGGSPTYPPAQSYGTATVATGALNVRSGPSPYTPAIASYYRNTVLNLAGTRNAAGTWVKVILPDGRQGWVNVGYVTLSISIWALPVDGAVVNPPVTPPVTPPAGYYTHVVQPGENLFRISLRYGVNMYTLAQLNGIVDVSRIYAGQVLYIPASA